jgi:hypothetical protein
MLLSDAQNGSALRSLAALAFDELMTLEVHSIALALDHMLLLAARENRIMPCVTKAMNEFQYAELRHGSNNVPETDPDRYLQ